MRINKKVTFILKLIVIAASFAFVFIKLYKQGVEGIADSVGFGLKSNGWTFLFFALLLTIVNWSIEAYKWILALRGIVEIHFSEAIKSIWYGVGVGLITPNRIGEPFGRIALIKSDYRAKAGVVAVLCSISQQLATLLYGIVGGIILFVGYDFEILEYLKNPLIIILLIFSVLAPIVIFFNVKLLFKLLSKMSYFKQRMVDNDFDEDISRRKLFVIFALSVLRYAVFSTQFVLLLLFFGFKFSVPEAYLGVFLTYLFASAIPSFALGEAGVRSSIAIVFIGIFWDNPAGITIASTLLWLVNVAMPGLVGVWFPFIAKRINR